MATSNYYLNMLFAYFKDGQYLTFPLFEDLAVEQIVYIRQLNLPDATNTLVPSFLVVAQDEKNIRYHQYYVGQNYFYSSLALLNTAINAISTANSFTLYTGLESIDGFAATGDLGGSIIVNDKFGQIRKYNVDKDNTLITVDIKQSVYYTKIVVAGDQTTAGNYYYDTYLA